MSEQRSPRHGGQSERLRGRPLLLIVIALVFAIAGAGLPWAIADTGGPTATTGPTRCPSLIFYYSRGSGQRPALNSPGIELYWALWKTYGAGEVDRFENGYPAAAVTFQIAGRKIPNLRLRQYGRSVTQGVVSARVGIRDIVNLCPQSHLILGGYSQGAQVTRTVLRKLDSQERARVAAVILFGDPYFNPKERIVTYFPGGDRRHHGILVNHVNARSIRIPTEYEGRIFSWCHQRDLICQGVGRAQKGQHGNYDDDIPSVMRQIAPLLSKLGINRSTPTHTYSVAGACVFDTCALAQWSEPSEESESIGSIGEGRPVKIVCQTVGETITGPNGLSSDIWDELHNGAFVTDYYVSTPGIGVRSKSISSC